MNKRSLKQIKIYLKNLAKEVVCSFTIKRVFLKDIKQKLVDFYKDFDYVDLEMIYKQFGTPSEIASGFGELSMEQYTKQAKKLKFLVSIISIIVVLLILILFIVLKEYGNHIIITD